MIELQAQKRENTRKSACREYRRQGFIPAVLYGQGKNTNLIINDKEFTTIYPSLTKSTVIDLKVDKKKFQVLVKDYAKDYIKGTFLHLDLYELKKGKPVHAKIPLHLQGNAKGMRDGGIIEKHLSELEVECLPKDIISHLDINIENMGLNESMHVSDITSLLDGKKFKILSHLEEVIVKIAGKGSSSTEAEAEETEGETEEE